MIVLTQHESRVSPSPTAFGTLTLARWTALCAVAEAIGMTAAATAAKVHICDRRGHDCAVAHGRPQHREPLPAQGVHQRLQADEVDHYFTGHWWLPILAMSQRRCVSNRSQGTLVTLGFRTSSAAGGGQRADSETVRLCAHGLSITVRRSMKARCSGSSGRFPRLPLVNCASG